MMEKFELPNEKTLLEKISDQRMKRADIAKFYFSVLQGHGMVDWCKINKAIIGRQSISGLSWIKNKAWKQKRRMP